MANIIQVDFKTKQVIKDYKQYQWVNALSGEMVDFDSRREDNVSRVPLVVLLNITMNCFV